MARHNEEDASQPHIATECKAIAFSIYLTLCVPLSLKGKGEGLKEGVSPLQTTLGCLCILYTFNVWMPLIF